LIEYVFITMYNKDMQCLALIQLIYKGVAW